MRTKEELLHTLKVMEINPDVISTVEHQRLELLIQVLIDIGDILDSNLSDLILDIEDIRVYLKK